MKLTTEQAEEIKLQYASAKASLSSTKLDFEIPSNNNDSDLQKISENELSKYVEARMEEIWQLAKNEIDRSGIKN